MTTSSGWNAMGKPICGDRRQAGYDFLKENASMSSQEAWAMIEAVSKYLERDRPYEAMKRAQQHLDLTGTYRLVAHLLTPAPAVAVEPS
jgi:hypothetical protein